MSAIALIRVEAGPDIGLGHLRRTASLAAALAKYGCETCFLTSGPAGLAAVVPSVQVVPLPVAPWSAADAAALAEFARQRGARFAVIDSYDATDDYLRRLRDADVRTVVVRDDDKVVAGDVIVRPSIAALPTDGSRQTVLGGPQFALLRPEYWSLTPEPVRVDVGQVVVTVGGADAYGLSDRLFRAALTALPSAEVRCVAGPFFSADARRALAASAANAGPRARVVDSPASPIDVWRGADLAVSGGGQTLYELAALGIPALAIEIAENQRLQVRAMALAGTVVDVGRVDDEQLVARVQDTIRLMAQDPAGRTEMHRAGRQLIDGRGALRLAEALLATFAVL